MIRALLIRGRVVLGHSRLVVVVRQGGAETADVAHGCKLVEENASAPRCYIRDPYGLVFNIARAEN